MGIVFQDAALFPHLTVFDNIAFGIKKQKAKLRKQRVEEMLALVGLSDFGERFPHQISGGQQQRVSIARALAPKPNLLLLDEPFSALDENLKNKLLEDVYKILHKAQVPSIFVTHSVHDALNTADRILILKDGHTQQLGSPHDVYFGPANEYVANFFGKTNILDAETISQGLLTCVGTIPYRHKLPLGEKLKIAVRPEDFLVKTEENCDGICSTVDRVRFCDSGCSELLINVKDQPGIQLCVQCQGDESICPKDNVHVEIVPEKVRILSGS